MFYSDCHFIYQFINVLHSSTYSNWTTYFTGGSSTSSIICITKETAQNRPLCFVMQIMELVLDPPVYFSTIQFKQFDRFNKTCKHRFDRVHISVQRTIIETFSFTFSSLYGKPQTARISRDFFPPFSSRLKLAFLRQNHTLAVSEFPQGFKRT